MKRSLTVTSLVAMSITKLKNSMASVGASFPDTDAELFSQGLKASPKVLYGDRNLPIKIAATCMEDDAHKITLLIESILASVTMGRTSRVPVIADPEMEDVAAECRAEIHGGVITIVTDPVARHCVLVDVPTDALVYTALINADVVLPAMRKAALAERYDNPIADLLNKHYDVLRRVTRDASWFLTSDEHAELMRDIYAITEAEDYKQSVLDWRGSLFYPLVACVLDEQCALRTEVNPHKLPHEDLETLWTALCVCEPMAFLIALAQMHYNIFLPFGADTNANVLELDVPVKEETLCPFSVSVDYKA